MRIIYSYNTFGGKRFPTAFDMRLAKLSVTSLRASTDYEPYLYTDLRGKDIFAELFDMDYIYTIPFTVKNPAWWNAGKLEVYAMQNEPFLHVDFDTCFMNGFSVPEDTDIITEKLRCYEKNEVLERYGYIGNKEPSKLVCSGLLGGIPDDTWRVLFKKAIYSIAQGKEPNFENLVSIEEYTLSQLAEGWELNIKELDPRFFAHFQGEHKQERFGKIIDNLCKMYGI